MKYREGYKYQLAEDEIAETGFSLPKGVRSRFINLTKTGKLTIKDGYAWDGASGPTFDTEAAMTPSLIHDALYQLMRHELIPQSFRVPADELFIKLCRDRGMWFLRARLWWRGLQIANGEAALPENKKKVFEAP